VDAGDGGDGAASPGSAAGEMQSHQPSEVAPPPSLPGRI
jgi:hypothetical protein